MWILVAIGTAIMALTHTAPGPFVLDAMSGDRSVWHMPPTSVPTVYLTFDDGPNLWDFNWGRERTADATLGRVLRRAKSGDIIVMHDGDESAPSEDQRQTVDATAPLIPALRARGFEFGTVCRNEG